MSKRTKKDIKHISDELGIQIGGANQPVVDVQIPSLKIDGVLPSKKVSNRRSISTKPEVFSSLAKTEEDPELQQLLLQVDRMLTEMTESKWLSLEYPNLQTYFSEKSKK